MKGEIKNKKKEKMKKRMNSESKGKILSQDDQLEN